MPKPRLGFPTAMRANRRRAPHVFSAMRALAVNVVGFVAYQGRLIGSQASSRSRFHHPGRFLVTEEGDQPYDP